MVNSLNNSTNGENGLFLSQQQAKYFAYELTKLDRSDVSAGISQALLGAQVDLNPHQIEAASFAVASPLSNGVILADEVGLGKTIEAGVVLCQYWAERRRHLIVVSPASLREQWKEELRNKFSLDAIIVDNKSFFPGILALTDKIIIMSYNFAVKQELTLRMIPWDLVVLDEAHKLRNVYKSSNKIGKSIEQSLFGRHKLLLTATPLQNSLMELYGLSTFIDRNLFGNERSFRAQFVNSANNYETLKERLAKFCTRTLRQDVSAYIRYTKRKPITFPFTPSQDEQTLYKGITSFLQKETLYALPARQKHLTSLVLYKLLASSSKAISATFETILARLENIRNGQNTNEQDSELAELIKEADLEDEDEDTTDGNNTVEKIDIQALEQEIGQVKYFIKTAKTIDVDAKTKELTKAIEIGFNEMSKMGAEKKALIFTESRRTQKYLFDFLTTNGYADKIVMFHGGNKTNRNELIEEFKNKAEIMIATEAGAEGLNMQFCSLLINYDLPFNPQRVEQRIGRCHRYGQKHDVVVINFVNKKNPADLRTFEILESKFKLFEGVFGASDEILGVIEDGVDFENKILKIYQTCRTEKEINEAFDALKKEMEDAIDKKMRKTKSLLLDHFDASVHSRFKVNLAKTKQYLDDHQMLFWRLAKCLLKNDGNFDDRDFSFTLFNAGLGKCQKYYFITQNNRHTDQESSLILKLSHPIGEYLINTAKELEIADYEQITFDVTGDGKKHSFLQSLRDEHVFGWCSAHLVTIERFEKEDYLVLSGMDNRQRPIDQDALEEMLRLNPVCVKKSKAPLSIELTCFKNIEDTNIDNVKRKSDARNMAFFREETDKIDHYTADKLFAVERELKDVKIRINSLIREERIVETLERRVAIQEEISSLERKKRKLRQDIFDTEDAIEAERNQLIENLKQRLESRIEVLPLFSFKWDLA